MPVSVLTLTRDRDRQLAALVAGLEASEVPPVELVVADMGARAVVPESARFPIRILPIDDSGEIPLAGARNAAAAAALSDRLVFLDVDCIPARGLVAGYDAALDDERIAMGGVRYLRPGASASAGDDVALEAESEPHPARPLPGPGVVPTDRYELLWSLSFAVRRGAWERIGGFDPGYRGYGAEDTDFAFAARAAGVPLVWAGGAVCFHQHHPQCLPPLDRFEEVVANARRFHGKWGEWPMGGWLEGFAELGLVRRDPEGLEILRSPTEDEVAAARVG